MQTMEMEQGQAVQVNINGEWLDGALVLVSENRESLAVHTDQAFALRSFGGMMVSSFLALSRHGETYREIATGTEIPIRKPDPSKR